MATKYNISGRIRNEEAVHIYICNILKALKIHRLSTKYVDVEFTNKLEGNSQGFCVGDKSAATIQIAKSSFDEKISFLKQMHTLAHEMVHAKQFLRGELDYDENGEFTWKNRSGKGYKYKNQPWEKEAEKLEKVLFSECFPFYLEIK